MAQLRNTTVNDTANLTLPAGTTAQRPSNPNAGQIRYNTTINSAEYYDGIAWRAIGDTNLEATGGIIVDTEIGGVPYRIHLFTNIGNSTFTVTKRGEVEYLIVAGGGGGSNRHRGGGGAGGVLQGFTTVTPQSYTITVGAGGAGVVQTTLPTTGTGGNGQNSSALGFTAIGGGAESQIGGSGGGSNVNSTGAAGTPGQGNAGGNGSLIQFSGETQYAGGGGGGAGSPGGNAISGTLASGGNGGQGIVSSISGSNIFYAGGGGGGAASGSQRGGFGGIGGGGNGGPINGVQQGQNGVPNTGGGGGSGAFTGGTNFSSGSGGSGIVVIRYRRNASTTTAPTRIQYSKIPNISTENWVISDIQRLVPTSSPRVLIHAESEGLNNVNGFRLTRVFIDGTEVINGLTPRSLRITQLRRTGTGWQYIDSRTYDAFGSQPAADAALAFLQTFQSGDLLINTTYDHINRHNQFAAVYAQNFFSRSTTDFTLASNRDSHLLVAIKNERLLYENYRPSPQPGFAISIWLE